AFTALLDGATGTPSLCGKSAGDRSAQATSSVTGNRSTNEEHFMGSFFGNINWGGSALTGKLTSSSTFILNLNCEPKRLSDTTCPPCAVRRRTGVFLWHREPTD